MQFLQHLAAKFRKPKTIRLKDLPLDERRQAVQELESVRKAAEVLRMYLRKIDKAKQINQRLNPLVLIKAERLQNRLSELVESLLKRGLSMDLIDEYVQRGSD